MKSKWIGIALCVAMVAAQAQTVEDLLKKTDYEIIWLGVDFSHVKLIGDFSQFAGAGEKSGRQIKRVYFPSWNKLILDEPNRYDIRGMLRQEEISIEIDMIMEVNEKTDADKLDSYNAPKFNLDSIQKFINEYELPRKTGISIVMIASSLNKSYETAIFHFVAFRNSDKNILIHEKIKSSPGGIGLRNYWAGAIYEAMVEIKDKRYKTWKAQFSKK
jgi:hypothetical protein